MDCFHKKVMGLQTIFANQVKTIFNDQSVFDEWESSLGSGRTGYCEGTLMEKAGFNVSFIQGNALPPAATAFRDELACQPYKAVGLSAILHPYNPKIPTAHMNIRRFEVLRSSGEPIIWFGGGFDLTPYFPIKKQVINWHVKTKEFLDKYDKRLYSCWKKDCDDYFYLKHRSEPRGIGGIFYDDFNHLGFENSFNLNKSVGDVFLNAYLPILQRRKDISYTEKEREFQLYRRGRYVEFNLI
ncbi:coproporphyrinogen III oxidase, partial [bacterium]|nr:coproporphyrinogen III oxidase [bacterium]